MKVKDVFGVVCTPWNGVSVKFGECKRCPWRERRRCSKHVVTRRVR